MDLKKLLQAEVNVGFEVLTVVVVKSYVFREIII
jgi:hypothetical protein